MSASNKTNLQQIQSDKALIEGIERYLPTAIFPIDGTMSSAAEVVATIRTRVRTCMAVLTTHAAWQAALEARAAELAATAAYVAGIRQTILAMYGDDPEALVVFEVSPRKRPPKRTAEEEVIAAAKAMATRAARHTMSEKEKLLIHGTLTGPVVVPVPGEAPSSGAAADAILVANGSPHTSAPAAK